MAGWNIQHAIILFSDMYMFTPERGLFNLLNVEQVTYRPFEMSNMWHVGLLKCRGKMSPSFYWSKTIEKLWRWSHLNACGFLLPPNTNKCLFYNSELTSKLLRLLLIKKIIFYITNPYKQVREAYISWFFPLLCSAILRKVYAWNT